MGAVFFLCSLVLFLGVKEQKCEPPRTHTHAHTNAHTWSGQVSVGG